MELPELPARLELPDDAPGTGLWRSNVWATVAFIAFAIVATIVAVVATTCATGRSRSTSGASGSTRRTDAAPDACRPGNINTTADASRSASASPRTHAGVHQHLAGVR